MSFLITDTLRFTLTVKREDTAWRGQHYDSLARIEIPVEVPIDWDGHSSGINVAVLDDALNFFKEQSRPVHRRQPRTSQVSLSTTKPRQEVPSEHDLSN